MVGNASFYLSSHFNHVSHEYFARGSVYILILLMLSGKIFRQGIIQSGFYYLLLLFSTYRAPFPQVCSGRLTNHMLQSMFK